VITGHWYILVALLLIVLIFYGPGKLPEIGGAFGKAMREFRNGTDSITGRKVEAAADKEHASKAELAEKPANREQEPGNELNENAATAGEAKAEATAQ
jgi:TatA/E family protein of Tat protein translocase